MTASLERRADRSWRVRVVFLVLVFMAASLLPAQTNKPTPHNPHGPISIACENCHTTISWSPIRKTVEFDHNRETKYPLRGMHQNVECNSCHVKKVFTNVGHQCADCHADLHRRQMGTNCQGCHSVNGWRVNVNAIKRHQNRFPLLGAHAAVECEACHRGAASGVFVGLSTECMSCHQRDFQQGRPLDHVAANLPGTCETCHTMDRWQGAKFDHAQFTRFSLTGAHAQLACTSCHIENRFQGTSTECFGCHAQAFTATKNPNHVAAGFPHDCSGCHTTTTWLGVTFDHNSTKFPLTGAHISVQCTACHVAGRFVGTPLNCSGCHLADFEKTSNPDHRHLNFSMQCDTCHTTANWQGAKFDHNTLTKFPLTGAHATVACTSCHLNGQFTTASSGCVSCHLQDFNKTASPNHVAAGFPTTCNACHTTVQWRGAKFDHNTSTKFALTGAHVSVACAQCHKNNVFVGLAMDCASCHLADFNKTTNPNHLTAGFPTNCAVCHNTTQWPGAKFDHSKTRFALTGAHVTVTCAQCHVGGKFTGTPMDCFSCHLKEYNATTNPPHKSAGFPTTCNTCHTTVAGWGGANFDHASTGFALVGAHTTVQCTQCHVNGNFTLASAACINCHLADYSGANNPPHKAAGFPQDCTMCHSMVTGWGGATFDHSKTPFPLTGAHVTVTCAQCHVGGKFAGTTMLCYGCHQAKYVATTNPNHQAAGFPTDCSVCHPTASWLTATFNHNTATKFALRGAHVNVACGLCHVNNVFAGLSTACANCHMAAYNATTNPPHKTSGFPTTCDTCHTTVAGWAGATFNHATTGFALVGAHTSVQCAQCHVSGNFSLTSATCINCHLTDYNGTTNPRHKTAGFPQDCTLCHTMVAGWGGATFNHATTGFALTGAHTSLQCAQCHTNNNYSLTSAACVNCHLTNYNATATPNHTAAGFPTTCDTCHSTTSWAGAVFDHAKTGWALTGIHATTACALCHVGGNFSLTATACYGCHQAVYQATTSPNHIAAGFPTTCDTCHTTAAWTGATFNHTWFRIPHHSAKLCTDCHANSSDYSVFVCTNCHLKPQTDANHSGNKNYVYDSAHCYACHKQ